MSIREPLGRSGISIATYGLLLLLGGCSLNNPAAPSWEVTLNLPLFNDTYEVLDLLAEEDFTQVGSDSLYTFSFEETLERIEVGSDLTLDGIDQTVSTQLGTFTVPAAATTSTATLTLETIYGDTLGPGSVPLPPFSFSGIEQNLPPLEGFSSVTIAGGTLDVMVANNTQTPFDTLIVELLDGGLVFRELTVAAGPDALPADTSVDLTADLAGLTISNAVRMRVRGSSPGGTIDTGRTQALLVSAAIGDLEVSSAVARVGELQFDTVQTVTLTDAADIQSATFAAGTLTLTFDNPLDLPLELDVTLPQVTGPGGTPLAFTLVPGSPGPPTAIGTADLSGHTITPLAGGDDRVLEAQINVYSPGSGTEEITLQATDTAVVRAVLSDLVLSEVTGVLDPTTVEVPEGSFTFGEENGNLLEELRKVTLGAVELELTFRHTVDFPAAVHLDFTGEGGVPAPVPFSLDIPVPAAGPAATPANPRVTVLTFDEVSHPELLAFLNAVPTTVTYSGTATIGDDTYTGGAASDDYFEVSAAFSVPAVLHLEESIRIEPDIEYVEEGIDPEVADRIQEASLEYEASSTLNLPVSLRLFIAADSLDVFSAPDIELVLRVGGSAQVGQDTTAVLTRGQWEVLSKPFYTGVWITIPPSGTSLLKVTSRDRLFLRAFAVVRALVEPGQGKGGGR